MQHSFRRAVGAEVLGGVGEGACGEGRLFVGGGGEAVDGAAELREVEAGEGAGLESHGDGGVVEVGVVVGRRRWELRWEERRGGWGWKR